MGTQSQTQEARTSREWDLLLRWKMETGGNDVRRSAGGNDEVGGNAVAWLGWSEAEARVAGE